MGIPVVSYCYHGDGSGESIPDGDLPIAIWSPAQRMERLVRLAGFLLACARECAAGRCHRCGWLVLVLHPRAAAAKGSSLCSGALPATSCRRRAAWPCRARDGGCLFRRCPKAANRVGKPTVFGSDERTQKAVRSADKSWRRTREFGPSRVRKLAPPLHFRPGLARHGASCRAWATTQTA
jgi:hypothetical protein